MLSANAPRDRGVMPCLQLPHDQMRLLKERFCFAAQADGGQDTEKRPSRSHAKFNVQWLLAWTCLATCTVKVCCTRLLHRDMLPVWYSSRLSTYIDTCDILFITAAGARCENCIDQSSCLPMKKKCFEENQVGLLLMAPMPATTFRSILMNAALPTASLTDSGRQTDSRRLFAAAFPCKSELIISS